MPKPIPIQEYLEGVKDKKRKNFILAALKMGVKIGVLSEDFRLLKLSWKGKKRILYKSKTYINKDPSAYFTKNKEITKILLQDAGINVPKGIFARNYADALRLMEKEGIFFPVVVKPLDAAEGFCVTVDIQNKKELAAAVKKIKHSKNKYRMQLSGFFMVEKLVSGNDYRILVLNNKVIACAERVPAYVTGDGKNNIRNLIKIFNKKRPPAYLLKTDTSVLMLLREKNLTLNSIMPKGQHLQLRKNANISTGGRAVDKTGKVSKRFVDIASKCTKALGLNYGGIDIMTDDITSNNPLHPYFIIEINGNPDYEPHEKPLVSGKGVHVAEILVKEFMGIK
jgi:cyanophycin synthetase